MTDNQEHPRRGASNEPEILYIHPEIRRSAAYVRFLRDQQGGGGEHPLNSSTAEVGPDRSKQFLGRPPLIFKKNPDTQG